MTTGGSLTQAQKARYGKTENTLTAKARQLATDAWDTGDGKGKGESHLATDEKGGGAF
jgi:hypothetical protein